MPPCVDPLNKTEEKPTKSFVEEEPWKRIIVLFAGAFFNFVSAIIFSFVFILVVGYSVPVVQNLYVNAEGAPYCAELRTGDEIIAVDGVKIGIMKGYDELLVDKTDGRTYVLTVIRDGEEIDVAVKMQQVSAKIEDKQQDYIGLGMQISYKGIRSGAGYALRYAVPYTGKLSYGATDFRRAYHRQNSAQSDDRTGRHDKTRRSVRHDRLAIYLTPFAAYRKQPRYIQRTAHSRAGRIENRVHAHRMDT